MLKRTRLKSTYKTLFIALTLGLIGLVFTASTAFAIDVIYPSNLVANPTTTLESWGPENIRPGGSVAITSAQPRDTEGSLEFNTADGIAKADLAYYWNPATYPNRTLGNLSALAFEWYRAATSTNPAVQAPVLRLYYYDAATNKSGLLIWEQAYNGYTVSVPTDTWVSSNIFSGNFWMRKFGPGETVENFGVTLAEWTANDDNGSGTITAPQTPHVLSANTLIVGMNVGVGSGWNGVFKGFVDNVQIAFGADEITANFEPTPQCTTICYADTVNGSDANGGTSIVDAKQTIQAAIDAVDAGGEVRVLPGNYDETAANRTLTSIGGTYQFGLFVGTDKNGITIQGVTGTGMPIMTTAGVLAHVTTNATNNFGASGVFVEGDDVTIRALAIGDNASGNNKTIEVIGDNFTLQHSIFETSDGGSLYINDFEPDDDTVQSYTIDNNLFEDGTQIAITSGAGDAGPVSGRVITNNSFAIPDGYGDYPSVSFNGSGGVPWFNDQVGGAIVTGNTFAPTAQYIRARGDYIESEFDWESFWDDNTYERAVVTLEDFPTFDVRTFNYISGPYLFTNVRRIDGNIQPDIDIIAQTGDTVLVAEGTYNEQVDIDINDLTLRGAGKAQTLLVSPDACTNTMSSNATAGVDLLGNHSGITLTGFSVSGYDIGLRVGENIGFSITDLTITEVNASSNCVHGILSQAGNTDGVLIDNVDANNNGAGATFGRGLWFINGVKADIEITDSNFNNNRLVGLDLSDGNVTDLLIQNNEVIGNGDSGIGVLGVQGPGSNLITENTVTNNGRYGIEVKVPNGSGATNGAGSIVVSNNTVSRTLAPTDARDYAGIAVFRRNGGVLNADQPTGVVVTGNTVTGFFGGVTGDGFGIVVEGTNHTVSDNEVTGNEVGLLLQAGNIANVQSTSFFDRGDANPTSATVTGNNISDNGEGFRTIGAVTGTASGNLIYSNDNDGVTILSETATGYVFSAGNQICLNGDLGMQNNGASTVNAAANWWGSFDGPGPVGPGAGDEISVGVNFAAFITEAPANTPCAGDPEPGTITLMKETNPDGSLTEFEFEVSWQDPNILLADGEDSLLPVAPVGTYTISEIVPIGWRLASIDCGDADVTPIASGVSIELTAGEDVVCTFNNEKLSNIIIDKVATGGGDTPFHFTYDDPSANPVFPFDLTDGGGDGLFDNIPAGTYTVSEVNLPDGWFLSSLTCDNANVSVNGATVTITLGVNETITCTFTNERTEGGIIIRKDRIPNGNTDFNYEVTQGDTLVSDGTFSEGTPANVPVETGVYTVAEIFDGYESGYAYGGVECKVDDAVVASSDTTSVNVTVNADETVICTFTNYARAQLTIYKQTDPNNDPTEFSFTGSANLQVPNFILSDGDFSANYERLAGSYTVTEEVPDGWDLASVVCVTGADEAFPSSREGDTLTVELDWGDNVTCTFNNVQEVPETGSITIVKQTSPDGSETEFEFDPSYGNNFLLTDGNSNVTNNLVAGSYTVEEIAPIGWRLLSVECEGGDSSEIFSGVSIDLAEGENITCTFTNEKLGAIIIDKVAIGGGNTAFHFTYDDPSVNPVVNFDLTNAAAPYISQNIATGTYTITEVNIPAGWDLSSIVCDGDSVNINGAAATINLGVGEEVTCTFTNVQEQPTTGTIVIRKETDPNGSAQEFEFDPSYGGNFNLSDGENNTNSTLAAGQYTVSEVNIPANWSLQSLTCNSNSASVNGATATINLTAGQTVTCTFTNLYTPPVQTCDNYNYAAYAEQYMSGVISVDIANGVAHGTITNNGTLSCPTLLGLASYAMFDGIVDNQELYDSDPMTAGDPNNPYTTIAANGGTTTFTVSIPRTCASQIDLFYGPLLPSLMGQRYGTRLFAWVQTNRAPFRLPFCQHEVEVIVTPEVTPDAPAPIVQPVAPVVPELDTDLDGTPDSVDADDDNDNVADVDDAFPLDVNESTDTDTDGTGNNADTDDDNDNVADVDDAFPLDASESVNTDLDDTGNNADTDDDNDGVADVDDAFPLDASESVDTDTDGTGNNVDTDDDNDTVADDQDAFPLDASESTDTDFDGTGNNADTDDDNDGLLDDVDPQPLIFNDSDGNTIGDGIDDSNNDGIVDAYAPEIDSDGDTFSNADEFTAGTNPYDNTSF